MKRKRHPSNARRPSASGQASDSSGPAPKPTLSPGRKWLFRFVAVFGLPFLLLGGAEVLLRLLGFGFDPHFFKKATIDGKECYVANNDFGRRFFPRSLVRIPDPAIVPAAKSPETFRIFIFGESAALGEPRPNFGAGSFLEALLSERFPQARFEIINTSMTAINSHVILPIARECAQRGGGDLWIVYMGNNEMVGPFGAATVFGMRAPPIWLLRAKLELQRLRVVQLVLDLAERLHKKSASANWQGMEMFLQSQVSPSDPRKQKVYQNFKENLDGILKAGHDSGAKIILSTMAVNLKDCPPFGSVADASLPEASRATFEKLCQSGTDAATQGRFADAQSDFQRATEIYPTASEPQFQLGTCLMRLTNATAARVHFQSAVDTDTLPFRSDSKINDTIREAARKFTPESLTLCDAAELLGKDQPPGVPGDEIFYEHVHFNPNGNYALAHEWAESVEKQLPPALKRGAQAAWASQTECEQLIGLTDWNRASTLDLILRRISSPPFSGRSGNAQHVARVQSEIDELQRHLKKSAEAEAQEVYLRALRRAPENYRLHENYAEFLEATHQLPLAAAERKKVCELVPYYYFPYYSMALDLKDMGSFAEARAALLRADALHPGSSDIRLELGMVHARQGEWESARQELEIARRLNPDEPRVSLYLGEVLWKLNRYSEAMASLREAIHASPMDWQPHYRLAANYALQGDLSAAGSEYQEALRLNPTNVKTKLGLAAVLMDSGHKAEALQQVNETLQLEPTNQAALEFQRKILSM